jgi:hypothetical protein
MIRVSDLSSLGDPTSLPGARYYQGMESDVQMFGLGDLKSDATGFAKSTVPHLVTGAIGYLVYNKGRQNSALKTAGAVVVGISLAKIIASAYHTFTPGSKSVQESTVKAEQATKTAADAIKGNQ